MSIPQNVIEDLGPIVESTASDMGRRYYAYGMGREDMASEGWLWIMEHPKKLAQWLDSDVEPYGMKKLARALRNVMHDAGEDAKAQHLGYSRDDLYHYHKGEVRTLLDALFDEEAWIEPPVSDGGPSGRRDPATGGNWLATLADVSQAFQKLSPEDKDLLHAFHRDGWTNKMLAEEAGVTEQTMSYRHDMAVKRLVDALGGPRPRQEHDEACGHVWRGRRAVSNSQARATQQSYYEED